MQIGQVKVEQEGAAGAELANRTRLVLGWFDSEDGHAVPSKGRERVDVDLETICRGSYAGGGSSNR